MFAVIKTGGKQYVVREGDVFSVEKLDMPEGQKLLFDQVLLVDDGTNTLLGAPVLEGALVKAEVVRNYKNDKILVFKKKRRKQYRRTRGHRQNLTEVRIEKIFPDKSIVPAEDLKIVIVAAAPPEAPAPAPKKAARPRGPKPPAPVAPEPDAKAIKAAKAQAKAKAKAAKAAPKKAPAAKPKPRAKKTGK